MGAPPDPPHLEIRDVRVLFPIHGGVLRRPIGAVRAVDGVDLSIGRGRTMGLVGESGSGKTTLGRVIMRVVTPSAGSVRLGGTELLALQGDDLRAARRRFQMVFQDPYASLNPRHTIGTVMGEPFEAHGLAIGGERDARIAALLSMVGLDPSYVSRYAHELSGGQRQRVGIARALAVEPELIVCDEPVSALDVSIQAQVVNLLRRLQQTLGLTYLFIAHDLAVVRHQADEVAVMYLGRIVERGTVDAVFARPRHPYTVALLSAARVPDVRVERTRKRIILRGDIPDPANPPRGCRFRTRCWLRERLGDPAICSTDDPVLTGVADGPSEHVVACHFQHDVADGTLARGATGPARVETGR